MLLFFFTYISNACKNENQTSVQFFLFTKIEREKVGEIVSVCEKQRAGKLRMIFRLLLREGQTDVEYNQPNKTLPTVIYSEWQISFDITFCSHRK